MANGRARTDSEIYRNFMKINVFANVHSVHESLNIRRFLRTITRKLTHSDVYKQNGRKDQNILIDRFTQDVGSKILNVAFEDVYKESQDRNSNVKPIIEWLHKEQNILSLLFSRCDYIFRRYIFRIRQIANCSQNYR